MPTKRAWKLSGASDFRTSDVRIARSKILPSSLCVEAQNAFPNYRPYETACANTTIPRIRRPPFTQVDATQALATSKLGQVHALGQLPPAYRVKGGTHSTPIRRARLANAPLHPNCKLSHIGHSAAQEIRGDKTPSYSSSARGKGSLGLATKHSARRLKWVWRRLQYADVVGSSID